MPAPISEAFADQLADPLSALAAMVIVARRHPGIVQWAAQTICAELSAAAPPKSPEGGNGATRPSRKVRGGDHRLAKRDKSDEKLLEAMRQSPDASIGVLAAAIWVKSKRLGPRTRESPRAGADLSNEICRDGPFG
jgi:hypothetical protein